MSQLSSTLTLCVDFLEHLIEKWKTEKNLPPLSTFNFDEGFEYGRELTWLKSEWSIFINSLPSIRNKDLGEMVSTSALLRHWIKCDCIDNLPSDVTQVYGHTTEIRLSTEWCLLLGIALNIEHCLFEVLHQFLTVLSLEEFEIAFKDIWYSALALVKHDLITLDHMLCLLVTTSGCDEMFLDCTHRPNNPNIPWSNILCILKIINKNMPEMFEPFIVKYLQFIVNMMVCGCLDDAKQLRRLLSDLCELPTAINNRALSFINHSNRLACRYDRSVVSQSFVNVKEMALKMLQALPSTMLDIKCKHMDWDADYLIINELLNGFKIKAANIIDAKSYMESDKILQCLSSLLKLWPSNTAFLVLLAEVIASYHGNNNQVEKLKSALCRILLHQSAEVNQQLFIACSHLYKRDVLPLITENRHKVLMKLTECCNKITQSSNTSQTCNLGSLIEFCWYDPYLVIKELVTRSLGDTAFCDAIGQMLRGNKMFSSLKDGRNHKYSSVVMTAANSSIKSPIKNVRHFVTVFLEAGTLNASDVSHLMILPYLHYHRGNMTKGYKQQAMAVDICSNVVVAALVDQDWNIALAIICNLLYLLNDVSDELNTVSFDADSSAPLDSLKQCYINGINLLDCVTTSLSAVLLAVNNNLSTFTDSHVKQERLKLFEETFKEQHWSSQLYLHSLLVSNEMAVEIVIPPFLTLDYHCDSTRDIAVDSNAAFEDPISFFVTLFLIGKRSPGIVATILEDIDHTSIVDTDSIEDSIYQALATVSITCAMSECGFLFESADAIVTKFLFTKLKNISRHGLLSRLYVDAYMKVRSTVKDYILVQVSKLYLLAFANIHRAVIAMEFSEHDKWNILCSVFSHLNAICIDIVPNCVIDEARAIAIPMATYLLETIRDDYEIESIVQLKASLLRSDLLFAGQ